MRLNDIHMCLYGSIPFPKAVAGQVATAKTAFAHATRALHLPYAWLQANAGHMLFAIVAIDVIDFRLHFLGNHEGFLSPAATGYQL